MRGEFIDHLFDRAASLHSIDNPKADIRLFVNAGVVTFESVRRDGTPNIEIGSLCVEIIDRELKISCELTDRSFEDSLRSITRFIQPKAKAHLRETGRIGQPVAAATTTTTTTTMAAAAVVEPTPIGSLHDQLLTMHDEQITRYNDVISRVLIKLDAELTSVNGPRNIIINIDGNEFQIDGAQRLLDRRISFTEINNYDNILNPILKRIIMDYNESVFPTAGIMTDAFRGSQFESQIADCAAQLSAQNPMSQFIDIDLPLIPGNPTLIHMAGVERSQDMTISFRSLSCLNRQDSPEVAQLLRTAQQSIVDGFARYNDTVRLYPPHTDGGDIVDGDLIAFGTLETRGFAEYHPQVHLPLFPVAGGWAMNTVPENIRQANVELLKTHAQEQFSAHRESIANLRFGEYLNNRPSNLQQVFLKTLRDGRMQLAEEDDFDALMTWLSAEGELIWFNASDFKPRTAKKGDSIFTLFEAAREARERIFNGPDRFALIKAIERTRIEKSGDSIWSAYLPSIIKTFNRLASSTGERSFVDLIATKSYKYGKAYYYELNEALDTGNIFDPIALLRLEVATGEDGTVKIQKIYSGAQLEGPHTEAHEPVDMPPEELSEEAKTALSVWEYIEKTADEYNRLRRAR